MSRSLGGWLLAATILVAAGGAWWTLAGPGSAVPGWHLVSGVARAEGGEWIADEAAVISDGRRTLSLAPGTRVVPPEGQEDLPKVLVGSAELLVDGSRVEVDSASAKILAGTFRFQGLPYETGASIPLVVPPAIPSPFAVRDVPAGETSTESGAHGQVIDARDGRPVAGALITATFSHFDDGYPPLPDEGSRLRVETDDDGKFWIPSFRPEDPRLKLHLETDHPEFEPHVLVLETPADADGLWEFATVRLRRADTYSLRFMDPWGGPLVGLAVRLSEPSRRDRFLGEDLWEEGQTFRAGRELVRYTDEDGLLRTALDEGAGVILHPALTVWDPLLQEPAPGIQTERRELTRPAPGEVRNVRTRQPDYRQYRLQDLAGLPIANALIEVTLAGMAPVRLYTGEFGEFVFGPRPFLRKEPRLDFSNPRVGEVSIYSSRLFKQRRPVQFPAPETNLIVDGRLGSGVQFQLMTRNEDHDLVPIPARGLEIDRDLTLVERTLSGRAVYHGTLPPSGTNLEVRVRGYRPTTIRFPAKVPGTQLLDLGEIEFDAGESVTVRLSGGDGDLYQRVLMRIQSDQDPERDHTYPFGEDGVIRVGGLDIRGRYRYALDGSRVERVEGEFVLFDEVEKDGLSISVRNTDEVEARLWGRVSVGPVTDPEFYRVVERYYYAGDEEPVTFESYPLPPDGIVGSVRILPRPIRAELFVHGIDLNEAYGVSAPGLGFFDFDLGLLELRPARRATFQFFVDGLGIVDPPPGLSLFAEEDRNHELAGLTRDGSNRLIIAFLRPGRHVLRWNSNDPVSDAHVFNVPISSYAIEEAVERRATLEEWVEVALEDRRGEPVVGGSVTSVVPEGKVIVEPAPANPLRPQTQFQRPTGVDVPFALGPGTTTPEGVYRVKLYTNVENEVVAQAPGFVATRATLPRGVGLVDPLVMRRGARVVANILDLEGYRFEGAIDVSWRRVEPVGEPDAIRLEYGLPFQVPVTGGEFASEDFPPGEHTFVFRQATSEAKTERRLELVEGHRLDLGRLDLLEGRTIRGTVELPTGEPAAGVVVALSPAADAFVFPQWESPLLDQKYSTRTDALGHFSIDGLPLDLREETALVAHLEGYTDAVVSPVDLGLLDYELRLQRPTELELHIGYADRQAHPSYEFRMEFYDGIRSAWRDLGPLAIPTRDENVYTGISPGLYRVTWSLVEAHPDVESRASEVEVWPARRSQLPLFIADDFVDGRAELNGEVLDRGWVVITEDPSNPAATRIGRVRDGSFEIGLPSMGTLYQAVIPERDPVPAIDFTRGSPLPTAHRVSSMRSLDLEYEAHELVVDFPAEILDEAPHIEIEFPHYVFRGNGFRLENRRERLVGSSFRLDLVSPGPFPFRVIARNRWSRSRLLDIDEDVQTTFLK